MNLDSEDEKAAQEAERQEQEKDFADLLTWLKETLADHVKEVRLSTRLTESPACLITDTFGMTPALARMYRASGQAVPVGKRILELNPKHPLVTGLQQAHRSRGDDARSSSPKPPNCSMAQHFLLKATYLMIRRSSPRLLADRLARTV